MEICLKIPYSIYVMIIIIRFNAIGMDLISIWTMFTNRKLLVDDYAKLLNIGDELTSTISQYNSYDHWLLSDMHHTIHLSNIHH